MAVLETLIFDTGPLSHFALSGWLGVLKAVVGERIAVIPETVVEELQVGAIRESRLQDVLAAESLLRRSLLNPGELQAFAGFAERLAVGRRNLGECGVLALGATLPGASVVVDDAAARRAARDAGIAVKPTLALHLDAIRGGLLTVPLVSALADDLLAAAYRLPFKPGGFAQWVEDNNLL